LKFQALELLLRGRVWALQRGFPERFRKTGKSLILRQKREMSRALVGICGRAPRSLDQGAAILPIINF
jgi:hypothetical protein